MSNTICIKHGANAPSNGVLQPFELGYVTSTGTLVIGDASKNTKQLSYLALDENGYIPTLYSDGNLTFQSSASNPKLLIQATGEGAKVSYGLVGSSGQAYILEYPPNKDKYEKYQLPEPNADLSANKTYNILTEKGGSFGGNFTFSGKVALNGAVVVDDTSYGTKDPNTAGANGAALSGTTGQLYFVITG